MKKIKFFLPLLGLAFAGTVFAYSGTHNFTNVTVNSSGNSYYGNFTGTGSFPFNGVSAFDRSRVNLKGTLTVDGQSYCYALSGTLKTNGGTIKTTQYKDTSCSVVYKKATYTVNSYSEYSDGSFSTVVKDGNGLISTLSGTHLYQ